MARIVIPGVAHHVTQRGNRQEDVFFSDADRQRYLYLLGEYSALHELQILAYCLMPNHVHLVAVPETPASLSGALRPVHLRYAQHINWSRDLSGVLWQGRFYSCPMDDRHFWSAVRYVEQNPVRAGLVEHAWDYPWSSAAGHCGFRKDPLLSGDLELADNIGDWQAWLGEPEVETTLTKLRRSTATGRPAGNDSFINRLEKLLGRTLRPKKGGRPRKKNLGTLPTF